MHTGIVKVFLQHPGSDKKIDNILPDDIIKVYYYYIYDISRELIY